MCECACGSRYCIVVQSVAGLGEAADSAVVAYQTCADRLCTTSNAAYRSGRSGEHLMLNGTTSDCVSVRVAPDAAS